MLHSAIVAPAKTSSSMTARTYGCTCRTARGETNSAHSRMPTTGVPMPITMFQGNGQAAKPQKAKVAKAKSSHANTSRSAAESAGRVPGSGVTDGVWDMIPVYGEATCSHAAMMSAKSNRSWRWTWRGVCGASV